jgi:SRSO17 transposase
VTTEQVRAIGPGRTAFLRPFERFFDTPETARHFRHHARRLLSDLPRKTAEPPALHAGVPPRHLQQFLRACLWDHGGLTDAVQRELLAGAGDPPAGPVGTVGIPDETSGLKKGDKTPGVQHQYLGCVGRRANGIVTVHLAVARGAFEALLDSEPYLPAPWDEDRDRCRAADIPDDLRYRPRWRIGLELVGRAEANGWRFDWLTSDEAYGSKPEFLLVLDLGGVRYVGEVPRNFYCRPGRSRTAVDVEAAFSRPGVRRRAARSFRFAQQTGPATVRRVRAVGVAPGGDRRPRHRLILARNRRTGEKKYFITNARRPVGPPRALAAGFARWNVEHVFRIGKGEVGLTHFEGRSYVSLKRHLALCLVALALGALHTMRLRGEKPGGDRRAGVPGPGPDVPPASGRPAGQSGVGVPVGHPGLPSTPERRRPPLPTEKTQTIETVHCAVVLANLSYERRSRH